MKLTFLFPLLGLAVGIYIGNLLIPGYSFPAIAIGLAIILWCFLHIKSKNPLLSLRYSRFHSLWITIFFIGIGALDFQINSRPSLNTDIDGEKTIFTAEIIETSALASGDRIYVKVLSMKDSQSNSIDFQNFKLMVKTDGFCGSKGDIIQFEAIPHLINGNSKWNENFIKSLNNKGIFYRADVHSDKIDKTGRNNSLLIKLSDIRDNLTVLIEKSSLSRPAAEFIISILLGNRSLLSEEEKNSFSAAGVAHILALSGLHVGIIFSLFLIILFPVSLFGYKNLRKILAILFVWVYVFISGAAPSTIRAAIMATFIVLAFILQRRNSALNALLASVFIILLFDPYSMWSVGLQLSFLSVLAILLFGEKLNPIDRHIHRRLYNFVNLILITLIASFSTWILVAYYFKTVPLLFLPSNLILLPLLPVFIITSFIYVIFLSLGIDLNFLSYFLDQFYLGIANITGIFGNSSSSLNLGISETALFLWILAVIALGIYLNSHKRINKRLYSSIAGICCVASVLLIITYKDLQPAFTLRFQHDFTTLEASVITDGKASRIVFPRNSVSSSSFENFVIYAIDAPIRYEDFQEKLNSISDFNAFLFVGPGSDLTQIARLAEENNFNQIVLHSNIGSRIKEKFLDQLNPELHDIVYSLRDMGSLELSL